MNWPQPGLPPVVTTGFLQPQPQYYTTSPTVNPSAVVQRAFKIPAELSGTIIGKGGRLINETRKATGATIKLMDPQPGAPTRMVLLSGTPAQVRNAYYNILGQLEGHIDTIFYNPQLGSISPGDAVARHIGAPSGDSISTLIAVDRDMIGGLIGKGGLVISKIRSVSGANINISKSGECAEPSKRLVTVMGSPAVVQCAKDMITAQLALVAKGEAEPTPAPVALPVTAAEGPKLDISSDGAVTLRMALEDEVAGVLIGRAGANINALRQRSGAQIRIGDRMPGQPRQITLTGNAEQLQKAQALITAKLLTHGAAAAP